MSRCLPLAVLAPLCLAAGGCGASQDAFLYELVDACSDADSISPWISTVESSERVYDEDGVGYESSAGPVHSEEAREKDSLTSWSGTIVLELDTAYPGDGHETAGSVELRGVEFSGERGEVDGTVDYSERYQSEGAGMEPIDDETYAFIAPDWSKRVTHIKGRVRFSDRWEGDHTVDLTLTKESAGDDREAWLEGTIDGRSVDRGY